MTVNTNDHNVNHCTYYDIMATYCKRIATLPQREKEELYEAASANLTKITEAVRNMFPCLKQNQNARLLTYNSITENEYVAFFSLLEKQSREIHLSMLAILKCIDSMLDLGKNLDLFFLGRNRKIVDGSDDVSTRCFEFERLNIASPQYGMLLPRVYCEWAKKTLRDTESLASNPLALALNNYYWVDNMPNWQITHLYYDFFRVGQNKKLVKECEPLVIASSPLDRQSPFHLFTDKETMKFYTSIYDERDNHLIKRMKSTIDASMAHNAKILLFPEYMGTPGSTAAIQEYIAQLMTSQKPKLYFLPTVFSQENGSWQNTLTVLDEDGDCIFKYHKQHPFQFDKNKLTPDGTITEKFFEPITSDRYLYILHIPGVGRLGVMICSDIFMEGYLSTLLDNLKISLLLYPTYTSGRDRMVRQLALTNHGMCDVILCNTCAAWDDTEKHIHLRPDNICFHKDFVNVYFPNGHQSSRQMLTPNISGLCDPRLGCSGCFFVTTIGKEYNQANMPLHYKLEEQT